MISSYILSKRFPSKCKGLSDARVLSITKKEYGFAAHCKDLKSLQSQYLTYEMLFVAPLICLEFL